MTETLARPATAVDHEPRCWRCRCMLATVARRPWLMKCRKCKAFTSSPPEHPTLARGAPLTSDARVP